MGIELSTSNVGHALLLFGKEGDAQKYVLFNEEKGKAVFCSSLLPPQLMGGFYQEYKK